MNRKGSIVTIGVFDGVHQGHRKIIEEAVSRARHLGLPSIAITFDPHPIAVLRKGSRVPRLISLEHRKRILKALGIDRVVILKFTRPLASMPPAKFVEDILIKRFNVKEVYVGENFRFGRGGRADAGILKKMACRFGFKVRAIRPVKIGGVTVSSSLIRRDILRGDLSGASRFLGRPVCVLGTVVKGSRLARQLGYPTANVNPHHEAIPPSGVYAVKANIGGRVYRGVLNIGVRPTFHPPPSSSMRYEREPTVEAHLFDFNKKIYGRDIDIIFIKRLRDEKRFDDKAALISQIGRDIKKARRI